MISFHSLHKKNKKIVDNCKSKSVRLHFWLSIQGESRWTSSINCAKSVIGKNLKLKQFTRRYLAFWFYQKLVSTFFISNGTQSIYCIQRGILVGFCVHLKLTVFPISKFSCRKSFLQPPDHQLFFLYGSFILSIVRVFHVEKSLL